MSTSSTRDDTILPKAAPMITPTAKSNTLPRITNALNSFNIGGSPHSRVNGGTDYSGRGCGVYRGNPVCQFSERRLSEGEGSKQTPPARAEPGGRPPPRTTSLPKEKAHERW